MVVSWDLSIPDSGFGGELRYDRVVTLSSLDIAGTGSPIPKPAWPVMSTQDATEGFPSSYVRWSAE